MVFDLMTLINRLAFKLTGAKMAWVIYSSRNIVLAQKKVQYAVKRDGSSFMLVLGSQSLLKADILQQKVKHLL